MITATATRHECDQCHDESQTTNYWGNNGWLRLQNADGSYFDLCSLDCAADFIRELQAQKAMQTVMG